MRTLTQALRAADPALPRPQVFPLADVVARSLAREPGIVGSIGLSRVIAGFLWGVTPTDPAMLTVVAATLLGVALAASWIPAREAAGLDPLSTLNCE